MEIHIAKKKFFKIKIGDIVHFGDIGTFGDMGTEINSSFKNEKRVSLQMTSQFQKFLNFLRSLTT
jgi:hypothetical protein